MAIIQGQALDCARNGLRTHKERWRRSPAMLSLAAAIACISLTTRSSFAAIYPDKHGNAGDILLHDPVVNAAAEGTVDYSVPYELTDSEGDKSGSYSITSEMLPGRDIETPSDDFVLSVFVSDDVTLRAAELVFRNNPNVAPAAPILRLYDCGLGTCVEVKAYDDPQYGCWIIDDQNDIASYPIELLDGRVISMLLEPSQLSQLPNMTDGTGNWAEVMQRHAINFEEAKFRANIDYLGEEQSDLLTSRIIAEIESENDCSYNDWLVRHWCPDAECDTAGVGISHGTLEFLVGHKDLIEAMSEELFDNHFNDWPTVDEAGEFTFPFGRMPIWKVDGDHEHGFVAPCEPDGPTENCHLLPTHWERVISGFGRGPATGECADPVMPLGTPGCYHDYPVQSYVPTLEPTPDAFTGPGETNNIGQTECTQVSSGGFIDRPCTDPADYTGGITATESGIYHNDIHGFIGGGFSPPSTTSGTMVFWVFHTNVSTNVYANWRHAQRRDIGTPERICNPQSYEAEDMFHSTGGSTPGGWNIWSNGYISTDHTFTPGPTQISVMARGQQAAGVWPHMIVTVDGVPIGDVSVSASTWVNYIFQFSASGGSQEIRVEFDNDFYQPPADRNLLVDSIAIDCIDPATASPCSSFCESQQFISWSGSYQSGDLGTGAVCRETTQLIAGGNCGNFSGGRQLFVNGTPMPCNAGNWPSLPAPLNGGYCVQATPGDYAWAYVTLW